jgi:2-C-methyl-D-erythritol 4-phosphate cytidylyltransferase
VVLALPPEDVAAPPAFLAPLLGSMLTIVPGGPERSDSVSAGLASLPPDCPVVLVHDGARPLVERGVIDAVIRHARSGQGAVAAVPLSDTIKEADHDDPTLVRSTVPRDRLWRAQTPQGFPRAMLVEAHDRARREGRRSTDDAALVEACGGTVRLVPDSVRNLKITTPDDLALAELLAEGAP